MCYSAALCPKAQRNRYAPGLHCVRLAKANCRTVCGGLRESKVEAVHRVSVENETGLDYETV